MVLKKKDFNTLISVIIPVYNVKKYLTECIDSVLNQTYERIEIILIDDGSTDGSSRICDVYGDKYENIKVIHKNNHGLGMARNTGLDVAIGDVIMFLDSDDYLDEDCLEHLYAVMKEKKLDFVKTGHRRVADNGRVIFETDYKCELFDKDNIRDMIPRFLGSNLTDQDGLAMSVCGALFRKKIIDDFGIRFPSEQIMISEDVIFNIDYSGHIYSAAVLPEIYYNYRYNNGSLTTQYRRDRFEKVLILYDELKTRFESFGMTDDVQLRLDKMFLIYLRMCIAQEKRSVSKKKIQDSVNRVKSILCDQVVQEIVGDFPVSKMGVKQRLFVFLMKHRCSYILYFLANINLL
ncbi:MAG: glycosyltransferase family 2 protein [Candidatus Saccharibacteria bacterium]|nr:glycosyltransferase family 2 protein [Candidatus Saccharibacteria bacterium]